MSGSTYQNEVRVIIIIMRQSFEHKIRDQKFNLKWVECKVRDNYSFNPLRLLKLIKGKNWDTISFSYKNEMRGIYKISPSKFKKYIKG